MPDEKPPAHRPPAMSRVPLPPAPREEADDANKLEELHPDDLIDARYRVRKSIGEGGVGRVYRAQQIKLGRDVAVKVLLDAELGNETHRPRFEREAMALASLNHPNIVSVQDYGVWRSRPFLVMEMLEGESLRERLDRGPLSEREALRITRELLHALAYAHSKGVVHRDLKPANIFLQSFPTQLDHVKILDFGFAKFVDNNALADAPALTQAGTTMGTPAYVAPERLYGSEVDGRSDLYSVGILLFEMLAGKKPFDGDISAILRAHLSEPVPALAERCPGLGQTDALTELFARALSKPVEGRFADAAAMLASLDGLKLPITSGQAAVTSPEASRVDEEELPTRYLATEEQASGATADQHSAGARFRIFCALLWRATRTVAVALGKAARRSYRWSAPRVVTGARWLAREARQLGTRLSRLRAAPPVLPSGTPPRAERVRGEDDTGTQPR